MVEIKLGSGALNALSGTIYIIINIMCYLCVKVCEFSGKPNKFPALLDSDFEVLKSKVNFNLLVGHHIFRFPICVSKHAGLGKGVIRCSDFVQFLVLKIILKRLSFLISFP